MTCCFEKQVGARKPDVPVFHAAITQAGYAVSSDSLAGWCHVGDDVTTDCVGGKSVGMRTVLIKPPDHYAASSVSSTNNKDVHIVAGSSEGQDQGKLLANEQQQRHTHSSVDHKLEQFSDLLHLVDRLNAEAEAADKDSRL
jgi:FMN phosphatase YigB (HAD superfamily)